MRSSEEIADIIVPEYRAGAYSPTGTVAKRWNAAYLAVLAAREPPRISMPVMTQQEIADLVM